MYKQYLLPKPRFVEWLFGIRPTIEVAAKDEPGNVSTIRITHRRSLLGYIEVHFEADGQVNVESKEQ